ncbi:MAG: ribosome small subunit-dependent GTPase A [Clostridium sp.]|nr:ribosome small subunit-dependent GTPase A [Clostridium sp.]MCM1444643.1 ribosome small subunit-dependent GTPase A [Candidatus Amulumruptor caecigallinarius]
MVGRIIKLISNDYTVETENGEKYVCKARGKFRNDKITPLVGDMVDFNEDNRYIMKIMDRKNQLIRPLVSNVDQAIVVTSVKYPDFSSNLLDKLLITIEFNNCLPIICFTKLDLLNEIEYNEIIKIMDYYKNIGYTVLTNNDLNLLKEIFKNKLTVFTGQSGAGKSTLLNKLDMSLNLKTNDISYALGRGKHTTRHVELINIYDGLVADTPGFSSLDFIGMESSDIRDNFIEFNEYKHLCKYRDCMHINETDCGVKQKVRENIILKSRYDNYLKFIKR